MRKRLCARPVAPMVWGAHAGTLGKKGHNEAIHATGEAHQRGRAAHTARGDGRAGIGTRSNARGVGCGPTDGVWSKYWYSSVTDSTGFVAYKPKTVTLTAELEELAERCAPYYERLQEHRLGQ